MADPIPTHLVSLATLVRIPAPPFLETVLGYPGAARYVAYVAFRRDVQ